jgi:ubiquitin-conjugating enzyme E2 C
MSSVPGVSAFPEGDNLLSWVGTIQGAAGTVQVIPLTYHAHRSKRCMMDFPTNYLSSFLLVIHTCLL